MQFSTRFYLILFILLIAILSTLTKNFNDPFDLNPKILVRDGHLVFQTAKDKNITFESSGKSSIIINGQDLARIAQRARQAITNVLQQTSRTRIMQISAKLDQLETRFNTLFMSVTRLLNANSRLDDLDNKFQQILGTGTNALQPQAIRRAARRFDRLQTEFRKLRELLSKNECTSNPCKNGGTCIDSYNGFNCKCTSNWEGPTCENDMNECSRFAGTELGCQNGATCINTVGSYSCQCRPNWFGIHCTEQHDDCTSSSNQALCVHGTCINQQRHTTGIPNYRCICDQGWTTGSTPACDTDINECTSTKPHCSVNPPVTCINLPGTFYCGPCPPGYSGNGYYCSDIDECQVNNGGCSTSPRVQCINTMGSRSCGSCPAGYVGNGITCEFTGMCRMNNGGCHPMAQCIENTAISSSYRECRCPNGLTGNGIGPNGCVPQTGTTCRNNPCLYGSCIPNGESFICICNAGYTGNLCENQINRCSSNPCQNNGTCIDQPNGFSCTCTSGWQGETCEQPRETCGARLNAPSGVIKYPNNRNIRYSNRANCAWIITTTAGKVLNITFKSFYTEGSNGCSLDFLQIHDGANAGAHLLGRFCGNTLPKNGNFITTHNQVYLWFKSDHSIAAEGFELSWNTTEPVCGGILNETEYGTINSPGYPGNYPNNRDCFWSIKVPNGKRIQFHFASLQIEQHLNCSFDYLEIVDGQRESDPILKRYCNSTTPPPITTAGPYALLHFHSDSSMSDHGFHVTYSSVSGVPGCGGTLTTPKGTITSPSFPERYDNNIDCDWLIRVHPEDKIQLTFSIFDLEQHGVCRWDYLEVRDGEDENAPLKGRFCGSLIPQPIVSSGNKLWVKFKADASFNGQGFKASYAAQCGGEYSDLEGRIKSPYFPDPYPSDRQCTYHIMVPQGKLIYLQFEFFMIEGSPGCLWDYLEIRENIQSDNQNDTLKICGSVLPDPITSTFNELELKFVTDGSVNNRGFLANYSTIDVGCGGVYTANHGSIATPNHPNFYPSSAQCSWLIKAPTGFIIRFTFTVFVLEPHANCSFDRVEVFDSQKALIGRFCGNTIPPVLTSSGNKLLIVFRSDRNRAHEGFAAAYSFLDSKTACGGNFFTETGVIRSPNYPKNYPPLKDCVWVLHAKNGRQIRLNVTNFDIEGGSTCRFDSLEIRNGGNEQSPLIGKFCGKKIPPVIISHSYKVYLRFKSDRSLGTKGFEIKYDTATTGCGGLLTSPTGAIVSPGYPSPYGHNAECTWLIRISKGSIISLSLLEVDIEPHSECQFDYIEIFNGDSDRSPSLGRFCSELRNPRLLLSKSNVLFIKFRSDASENGRGFRLSYEINCTTTLRGVRGVIESPNFPEVYPNNANCTWTIEAPRGNNITVAFSSIVIERGSVCQYDYLEISEMVPIDFTRKTLSRFCGTPERLPAPFNISSHVAFVNFVSDNSVGLMGFRMEWITIGCGGEIYLKPGQYEYGQIQSPNYPNGYPLNTECIWHLISTQSSHSIELNIIEFDMEYQKDCSFDYLNVYGGIDDSAPLLQHLCHRSSNVKITSMGQSMTVKFVSDPSINGRGFRGTYTLINYGCSQIVNAESGTITSPGYPSLYDSKDDCEYFISVNGLHNIELTFNALDIPYSINCSESYISIYDGYSSSSPLLTRKCGLQIPSPIRTTSNQVYLRFKANGKSVGKGFSLAYKSICGGRKVIGDNEIGELTSPNYPHESVQNGVCHWILTASSPDKHISFIFTHIESHILEQCSSAGIELRDGDTNESPLIGRYCGSQVPPPIVTEGSALFINKSELTIFRATYSTSTSHCGGDFTGEQGYFMSPNYPNSYPIDTECIWTIRASIGNRVTFNFISFDIESSEFCNSDYLELREIDSAGNLLGKYCGSDIPVLNFTSTNILWVKFRSDQQGTAKGFQAHYALEHGINLNGTNGRIASPGYPNEIKTKSTMFTWTIMVPVNNYVKITFLEFLFGTHPNGECYSYVQLKDGIGEGAPELSHYCGFRLPDPIASHSNVLTVNLVTIYQSMRISDGKFLLQWDAVNRSEASGLRPTKVINVTAESFQIELNTTSTYRLKSPGYPTGYANNLNYNWTITTSSNFHLKIKVIFMNVEGYSPNQFKPNCFYDGVKFLIPKKFLSSEWHLNRTLCGRWTNETFELQSNVVRINFFSDRNYNKTGFELEVSAQCGGILHEPSGIISTDDVMKIYNCEWIIVMREGRTVQITFEQLNFVDSVCDNSYILLRNGGSSTSPFLGNGKYCGNRLQVVPESSSNQVYVKFYAAQGQQVSFRLRYNQVSVGCGNFITLTDTMKSTEITSPNFPGVPPHDVDCEWVIMGPPQSSLRLEFITDSQRFHCNKSVEFIEIRDGGTIASQLIDRYCVPPTLTSSIKTTGNFMHVRFVASGSDNQANFRAKIDMNDCGGTYFINGWYRLTSPDFPKNYSDNMECKFVFRTYLESYYFQFTIDQIDMPSDINCTSGDFIEFRENDVSGNLIGRYCGSQRNQIFSSKEAKVLMIFKSDTSETGIGFAINIEVKYSSCGSTIADATSPGIITSPKYPYALTHESTCKWFIYAPPGRSVKLTFLEYNLKVDSRNITQCLDQLNVLFTLFSNFNSHIQLPCGAALPPPLKSPTHFLRFHFITRGLAPYQGFKLRYSADEEEACGGKISGSTGDIASYRFGETNYTEQIHCGWNIEISNNMTLAFVFDVFETYAPANVIDNPDNQCYNYNYFSYGHYDMMQRYFMNSYYTCGNKTTSGKPLIVFFSTFNYPGAMAWAEIVTNYSNGYRGIRGKYYIQPCGGTFENVQGEFTSPQYPNTYPSNSYCQWIFRTDWGQRLQLSFVELNLDNNCDGDYIEVYEEYYGTQTPVMGKFCGSSKPNNIISFGRMLRVVFVSDAVNNLPAKGFKMKVENYQRGCGGHMPHYYGSIDYRNYNKSTECIWTVEVPIGYHINFSFVGRFDLETSNDCINDYVLVEEQVDSEQDSWRRLGRFCSFNKPDIFISKKNKVKVTFHSNENNVVGDGFQLDFKIACGGVITDPQGVITSPNYPNQYSFFLDCEYLIQRNPNDIIIIEFDDQFGIEKHPSCMYDYLDIYLGNNTKAPHYGPYCSSINDTSKPPMLTSTGALLLKFHSDSYYNDIGFKANYTSSVCGQNLTDDQGLITSPLHPFEYRNMRCIWHVTVSPDKVIEFKFSLLDMENCWDCRCDFVEFRDGDNSSAPLIGRFCGRNEIPPTIKTKTNQLWILFKADAFVHGKGFRAGYRATIGERQGCGGLFNTSSGVIQTPDIDKNGKYDDNLDCWWHIIVEEDNIIKLTFEYMDIEPIQQCSYDFLEIFDGIVTTSLIDKYCSDKTPAPVFSSSNKLELHFQSDNQGNRRGFKLSFTSQPSICSGVLNVTNTNMTIASPSYPNVYPASLRCRWQFVGPSKWFSQVELTFNDLDVNCSNNDYIELKMDNSKGEPYHLCGKNKPPKIVAYSGLLMTFNSSPKRSISKGFSLSYKVAECNQTYDQDNGIIASPRYQRYHYVYGVNKFCQFNITAPPGYTISMYFYDFFFGVMNNGECIYANMTVRDGLSPTSPLVGTFCGQTIPEPIFSQSNAISVNLTNTRFAITRYIMTYTTTNAGRGCGGNLTAINGTFTSPLYPNAYNQSAECKWILKTFGLHTLTLQFKFISLTSTIGCQSNYIEVFNGDTDDEVNKITRICGDDNPAPFQSETNVLLVKLVTSANNTGSGFRAQYNYNKRKIQRNSVTTTDLNAYVSSKNQIYFRPDISIFNWN